MSFLTERTMKLNQYTAPGIRRVMAAVATAVLIASPAAAQNEVTWLPVGVSNWNTGSNWDPFGAVPSVAFDEQATIGNGGTAFLDAAATDTVGGLALADTAEAGGTLEIRDGGSLNVSNDGGNSVTTGTVFVGDGNQTGTLIIERGGSLTTERLSTFVANGSSVELGSGAGGGMATLNADASILRGETRITGSNVDFTTGQLQVGGLHNLIAEITGVSHSAINVTGFVQLNGQLTLEFNGVTPSVGDSWPILDAGGIAAGFIGASSSTPLGAGRSIATSRAAGGNGTVLSAEVVEVLTLKVNRDTGDAVIANDSGSSLGLSGYNIASPSGSLSIGWNSLADQATGGFEEAAPTANNLSELDPTGSTSVSGAGLELDGAYAPSAPFGTPLPEDLTFSFQRDDGRELAGLVEFEGDGLANTLVLTIDPSDGDARVTNDSTTALNLDVYSIESTSGSLLTTWNSLQDQGTGGWQEANPSTGRLSELEPTGELALAAGGSFDLDGLWNTGGVQDASDFTFIFRDPVLGEFTGIVEFDALVDGLLGDSNGDGVVNTLDIDPFVLALTNPGQYAIDFPSVDFLANNDINMDGDVNTLDIDPFVVLLTSGSGSAGAIPEPDAALALLIGVTGLLLALRAGQRRPQPAPSFSPRTTQHTPSGAWSMNRRFLVTAICVAMPAGALQAQTTITGADIAADLTQPFADGSITISPFGAGGSPVNFGPATENGFIGPEGGTNDNAVDDADGDPATTADRERLDVALASGVSLTQFAFTFSRANPILVSGFGSDPLASFTSNPGGGNSLTFDATTNTLAIFHPAFTGTESIIDFGNGAATDGQTLSFAVDDFFQAAPQISFRSFTYDSPSTVLPGDVDGLNGVTIDDFNIIRDNFSTAAARAGGDLTGDGLVTLADFSEWEANFGGSSAGLAGLLGVPEPATIILALALLSPTGLIRRRLP